MTEMVFVRSWLRPGRSPIRCAPGRLSSALNGFWQIPTSTSDHPASSPTRPLSGSPASFLRMYAVVNQLRFKEPVDLDIFKKAESDLFPKSREVEGFDSL